MPDEVESKTKKLPVAVISDGKPGHENQSLGIAERLPAADIFVLRHHLKESFTEAILRLRFLFSDGGRSGRIALLKRIFSETEIMHLLEHHPLAIIAAGTLSAGPCLVAGKLTGARTCICMKPSLIPISRFDLAIIPSHDDPPNSPNVVKTLAAPNRVSPEHLLAEAEQWKTELPFSRDPIVSWIIGGPSSSAPFSPEHVLDGLTATLQWAQENHWQVWLSTARRTPESLEKKISELAQNHPALAWTLLWHRDRRNPLYAMFAVSNVAVVTSDSVSMIAEAASAGRGPVVYQASPQTQKRKTKHDRMVSSLVSGGFCARAAIPIDLIRELRAVDSGSRTFPILNDTDRAADRLLELLRS
jgi:hypothetical protein